MTSPEDADRQDWFASARVMLNTPFDPPSDAQHEATAVALAKHCREYDVEPETCAEMALMLGLDQAPAVRRALAKRAETRIA